MTGFTLRPGPATLVAFLLIASAAPLAHAQSPEGHDAEAAEVLFRDGKSLFDAHHFPEACPKLAESQRLDPAGGTLLLLALCYEGEGKTASAWSTFNEALGVARRDKRTDRITRSQERLSALEPRLSKLTVRVPPELAASEGVEVRRNGRVIPRAVWGSALPVDPGPQRIEVTATGKKAWVHELTLGVRADHQSIDVGLLEDLPASPPPPPAAPSAAPVVPVEASAEGPTPLRITSYVVGAVSLVALGGGGYLGWHARSLWNSAQAVCPGTAPCGSHEASDQSRDAHTAANRATLVVGLGAAGLVGGLVLFSLSGSPTPAASSLRVVPALGLQGGGLVAQGGF
jgi:hypothetical protein